MFNIIKRVAELKQRGAARIVLTKQFVLEAAIDNLEKARGLRPIRIGSAEEPKDVEQNSACSPTARTSA